MMVTWKSAPLLAFLQLTFLVLTILLLTFCCLRKVS